MTDGEAYVWLGALLSFLRVVAALYFAGERLPSKHLRNAANQVWWRLSEPSLVAAVGSAPFVVGAFLNGLGALIERGPMWGAATAFGWLLAGAVVYVALALIFSAGPPTSRP